MVNFVKYSLCKLNTSRRCFPQALNPFTERGSFLYIFYLSLPLTLLINYVLFYHEPLLVFAL